MQVDCDSLSERQLQRLTSRPLLGYETEFQAPRGPACQLIQAENETQVVGAVVIAMSCDGQRRRDRRAHIRCIAVQGHKDYGHEGVCMCEDCYRAGADQGSRLVKEWPGRSGKSHTLGIGAGLADTSRWKCRS